MKFVIRPMRFSDIPQVTEIDKEAFPTMWPLTSFKRELTNKLAFYFVACENGSKAPPPPAQGEGESNSAERKRGVGGWLRGLFSSNKAAQASPVNSEPIVGFAGVWRMFDEVHLTSIAVRQSHRRQGIGEALLIAAMDYAVEHGSETATLEVRVSNLEAQALYERYGFKRVGLRHGYYTDNHEDALIMTTDRITSAPYQAQFQKLKQEYSEKRSSADARVQ